MQRFIEEDMEASEDTDVPPGQYSEAGAAQYPGAAYDFTPDANEYIAIDQSLDTSPPYQTTDPKINDANLGNHMAIPSQNGHVDAMHAAPGLNSHTNATPQSTTALNPSTKRKSPEDPAEIAHIGGDSKRKRSKVSRACDQCRKKKIRCDADAEGTGQLKTCTNCQKSGQTCEYSRIPQKRGPSKGYIKELSERVQQVEGQLALQNSTGYRSSFDGQSGAFGDAPFSPDDDPAYKNRSSFSQQRSPFADFTRDRFPSTTSWHNNSVTSNPRHQSIAIPPDQIMPSLDKPPSSSATKLFWTDWIESPSKKRKASTEGAEMTEADKTALLPYYEIVHPLCPVLPDAETQHTAEIINLASKDYQNAFISALKHLPQKNRGSQSMPANDMANGKGSPRSLLEKFINEKAREPFTNRSDYDSLVLLWTELILLVVVLQDVSSWTKPNLPECDLIRMSLDLCDEYFKSKPYMTDVRNDTHWTRSAQVAAMLARLYAISKGESHDPVPSSFFQHLLINVRVLPPRVLFLVHMAESLLASLSILPDPRTSVSRGTKADFARLQNANLRAILSAVGMTTEDPIATEVKAFSELLSLRCNMSIVSTKPAVIGPAANLTQAIRMSSNMEIESGNGRYIFNPLSFHTYTLATITLLEVLQCAFDEPTSDSLVEEAIEEMRQRLAAIVERRSSVTSSPEEKFWGTVMLDMLEQRMKLRSSQVQAEEEKGEDDLVLDLAALIQRGYAQTVIDFAASR